MFLITKYLLAGQQWLRGVYEIVVADDSWSKMVLSLPDS